MTTSFPLYWPAHWPRTGDDARNRGNFLKNGGRVRQLLLKELALLRATEIVISSNVAIRRDGLPYAGQKVEDPGVVLYFKRNGQDVAIPCDRWTTVDSNLRAIGMTVEAIRGMERWGTNQMVNATFQGFAALPANVIVTPYTARAWHEVLGVNSNAPANVVKGARDALLRQYHTDNPETGDANKLDEVMKAWNEYRSQA